MRDFTSNFMDIKEFNPRTKRDFTSNFMDIKEFKRQAIKF